MAGVKQHIDLRFLILALIYIVSLGCLGFYPEQSNFRIISTCFTLSFGVYAYWIFFAKNVNLKWLIGIAVMVRFMLLFAFPNLSDDIYRFIWDGRMLHTGYNPYLHLPSDIVGQHPALSQDLYDKLNSPDYYTIYTPINQLINWIATAITTSDYYWEAVIYKGFLFAAELLTMIFLVRICRIWGLPAYRSILYLLNPLVIIEIMANAHFEGVMVMFICLSLYYLSRSKLTSASLSLSGSIGAKILPLMFTPAWLNYYYHNKNWKKYLFVLSIGCIIFLCTVVYSILFLDSELSQSLGLYINKFEFNGGIYYLLRWIGYQIYGFNLIHIIGPLLTGATLISILYLSFKTKIRHPGQLSKVMFFSWLIFLLLSRTLHPWYLIPLIFLGSIQNQRYYFYALWSYLITWTYKNYSYTPYYENIAIVSVEYTFVFTLIYYEVFHKDNAKRVSLK